MRTTNFDAIAAAAPLNRTASTVRDGSGDTWEPTMKSGQKHWKAPPLPLEPFIAVPGSKWLIDLTGRQVGRLTVVRYHGRSGVSTPEPMWLVRCVCGDYELRRAKSIIKETENDPCCLICRANDRLRTRTSKTCTKADREAQSALLDRLATKNRFPAQIEAVKRPMSRLVGTGRA
jgi:hypothetical protein